MSSTTCRTLWLGLLFFCASPGCAAISGSIQGDTYRSKAGSVQCSIPHPESLDHTQITDFSSADAESVSFLVEFAWLDRIEYLRVGSVPLAERPAGSSPQEYLELVAARLVDFIRAQPNGLTARILEQQAVDLHDSATGLLAIMALDLPASRREFRGLLLFLEADWLGILQHTHPIYGPDNLDRARARVLDLYRSCRFGSRAGSS